MGYNRTTRRLSLLLATLVPLLPGCAAVKEISKAQKPTLAVQDTRITGLSFDGLDLVFDIAVHNPNPLALKLTGIDYDFQINNASFLQGGEIRWGEVEANSNSIVEVPLTLKFDDLFSTFADLKDQDSTAYHMTVGLALDVPILGMLRVPLEFGGQVPVVKPPTLDIGGLKVEKLHLTGADLALELSINNPNGFDLGLDKLDYQLGIGGQTWAEGVAEKDIALKSKTTRALRIPLSVDFTRMGLGLFKILSGKEPLDYQFNGGLDLSTSLPLLPNASLTFDRAGKLDILR